MMALNKYDEDLTNLDDSLRRLKIEYHIFFSGNRRNPPDDLRMRVEKIIKRLSESSDLAFSQRFRFNTLIARFYLYRDLWRRTQLDKEMGIESKKESPREHGFPHSAGPSMEKIKVSISDPEADEKEVRRLYDALLSIKGTGTGETLPSYAQFSKYITTQTRSIREKYGCSAVAFTVALEDDVIRFKAAADDR
jgi:hypothetical protein